MSLRVKEIEASPGDICGGDISLLDVDSCSTNIVVDMNWNLTRYLKIKHRSNQQYGIQQNMYKLKLQGVVTVLQETFTTDLPEITVKYSYLFVFNKTNLPMEQFAKRSKNLQTKSLIDTNVTMDKSYKN